MHTRRVHMLYLYCSFSVCSVADWFRHHFQPWVTQYLAGDGGRYRADGPGVATKMLAITTDAVVAIAIAKKKEGKANKTKKNTVKIPTPNAKCTHGLPTQNLLVFRSRTPYYNCCCCSCCCVVVVCAFRRVAKPCKINSWVEFESASRSSIACLGHISKPTTPTTFTLSPCLFTVS